MNVKISQEMSDSMSYKMEKYIITLMVCLSILASSYLIKTGMVRHSEAIHSATNEFPYIFYHSYDGRLRACEMKVVNVDLDDNSGLLDFAGGRTGFYIVCSAWFTGNTQSYEINDRQYSLPEGLTDKQAMELVVKMENERKKELNEKEEKAGAPQNKNK